MCVCVCVCVRACVRKCVCVCENSKKKNFFFFFEMGIFFFKLGKKSPKSHWERISAPEDTKKKPVYTNKKYSVML